MDNTRIARRKGESGEEIWKACTHGSGRDFSSLEDAKNAAELCMEAYKNGRASHAKDIKSLLDET